MNHVFDAILTQVLPRFYTTKICKCEDLWLKYEINILNSKIESFHSKQDRSIWKYTDIFYKEKPGTYLSGFLYKSLNKHFILKIYKKPGNWKKMVVHVLLIYISHADSRPHFSSFFFEAFSVAREYDLREFLAKKRIYRANPRAHKTREPLTWRTNRIPTCNPIGAECVLVHLLPKN